MFYLTWFLWRALREIKSYVLGICTIIATFDIETIFVMLGNLQFWS